MAAVEEAMTEMADMIEALNQRMLVMEVEALRRNDERALEVAAMTATKEAAEAAVEQSKVSEIATINLMSMLEEKVALTKVETANHIELLDIKLARYDTRLTALIENVKDNARGIIEEILEEKEQEPQKRKDWKREIMESKAIGQIDRLADGKKYRQWLSKFKNLFDQARRGGRVFIAFLETLTELEVVDQLQKLDLGANTQEAIVTLYNAKLEKNEFKRKFDTIDGKLEELDSELWSVLVEKTEGEAYDKVQAVEEGDGMMAFVKMHNWFSRITESGVTNRLISIMKPEACKNDWAVAGAIEKWE